MTRKSYDWFLFTALIHLDWLPGWAPMMVQALTNLSSITAIAPLKPPVQTIITGATWRQIWTAFPVNWKIANEREFVEVEAKEHLAEPQAGAPGNHLWWGADGVCFSPDPENNSLRLASNSNYETIFKNHLCWVGRWRDPENNAISRIGTGPLTKLFWGNKNYFDDRPSLGGNEATGGRKNVEQDRSNIQSDGDPDSNLTQGTLHTLYHLIQPFVRMSKLNYDDKSGCQQETHVGRPQIADCRLAGTGSAMVTTRTITFKDTVTLWTPTWTQSISAMIPLRC